MSILNRSSSPIVEVMRLSSAATLPTSAHLNDVGLDLYSNEDLFIKTGETAVVGTGIAIGIPNGYYAKIEDRSSMAAAGLRTGAGVVDSGYNGEIKIVLHNLNNTTDFSHKGQGYQIKKGQRIAQLIVQPVIPVRLAEVERLNVSDRGSNGFGSSGR
jgi:dUTP pyrophosphatase